MNVTSCGVWQFFNQQVADMTSQQTRSSTTVVEVDLYLKAQPISSKEDPFTWWKNNKHIYPTVVMVAIKYLCVLATSVPSEGLFSKAGELVSHRRSSIKPENVDMMLFLNKYWSVYNNSLWFCLQITINLLWVWQSYLLHGRGNIDVTYQYFDRYR